MRRKPPYVCVCGESFTKIEDLTHHKEWACDRVLKQRKKYDDKSYYLVESPIHQCPLS